MFRTSTILGDFNRVRTYPGGTVNTPFRICRPNPDRALLYICVQSANPFWLWQDAAGDPTKADWAAVGPAVVRFTWELDGPMSTQEWWCTIGAASGNAWAGVTEWIFWPPTETGSDI
jgi:hypothetical protein